MARAALPLLRAAGASGTPASLVHGGERAAGAANAVAPGAVDTAFLRGGIGREAAGPRLDVSAYASAVPMGRIATAEDVAAPSCSCAGRVRPT